MVCGIGQLLIPTQQSNAVKTITPTVTMATFRMSAFAFTKVFLILTDLQKYVDHIIAKTTPRNIPPTAEPSSSTFNARAARMSTTAPTAEIQNTADAIPG